MPRGKQVDTTALKLDRGKIEYVSGEPLMKIQHVAKLSGIPAAVLEMGQKLLKSPTQGGVFMLAGDAIPKASDIEQVFVKGLRKVAKALGAGQQVKSHYDREVQRLYFWYTAKGAWKS